jgi:ketosteroid isomerase-like protein
VTEDEDRIREINEAMGRGDLDTVSSRVHADAIWEHNIGGGSPEEGVYAGRESILELFARILEPWEHMRLETRELRELEDGTYLIRGELHFKHRTSDVEVRTSYEQRIQIRDGLLVKGTMTMGQLEGS